MKKLKKSLLVVPALGVLMLAAAGSVGGTVAWFSSVNTFETDVSSFAVGRVDGNLDVTMTADNAKGTQQVGNSIAIGHKVDDEVKTVKLTHGSFNHGIALAEASVWTINQQGISEITEGDDASTFKSTARTSLSIDRTKFLHESKQIAGTYIFTFDGTNWDLGADDGRVVASADISVANLAEKWGISYSGTPTSEQTLAFTLTNSYKASEAPNWMYSATAISNVFWYHAVHWQMTFNYTFGVDATARRVYFDTDSSIRKTATVNVGDEETYKGFRIAFKNSTAAPRNVIWAPEQTATADIHYVSAQNTLSDYSDSDTVSLLYKDIPAAQVNVNKNSSGSVATASTNKNYLCQLTSDIPSVTIDCVAWFEGSDPNVINQADLDTVAASLKFFAVPAAA